MAERGREREIYIFPVVTGTHYGTKTPPDQQPTELSQGYDETRPDTYLQCVSSMVFLGYAAWFGM